MTPTAKAEVGRWGSPLTGRGPTWLRVATIVAVLGLALVVAQTCQKSQVRLNKDQAIVKAQDQIDFIPKRTQIRLLRQGIPGKPYWIISLSRPGKAEGTFSALAVVRIDANSGKVVSVKPPQN